MSHPWLQRVSDEFRERLDSGRLPHALLLSGPAETGKLELARRFTATLLCEKRDLPACGACRSCRLLEGGAHPDRHLLTFEENTDTANMRKVLVVDQVRRLIQSLSLTTTISPLKTALIHPAEALNKSAANALLKTLEEPPGEAVLILVAHDPMRLPATIRSRCQNLRVMTPRAGDVVRWLVSEHGCEETEAALALRAAAGSPLGALRVIEDGNLEDFRKVAGFLRDIESGRAPAMAAAEGLAEIEPALLWNWVSGHAAERVRTRMAAGEDAREVSRLQQEADRNRRLIPTSVRKDFLLHEWLIQWARLEA